MSTCLGQYTPENFQKFHQANQHIYAEFEKWALVLIARGYKHYSAKQIFGGMRWESAVRSNDPHDKYKINDGWISHYARLFIENNPTHKDFFKFKTRRVSYFNRENQVIPTGGPQNDLPLSM